MNGTKSVDENFQNDLNRDRERVIEKEMEEAGWDKNYKDYYLWYKNNPEDYEDYSI